MTYPPRPIKGAMVTGMLTPRDADDYTYPPDLREEISQAIGEYVAHPYAKLSATRELLEEILYWLDRKEALNEHLLRNREWDFFMDVVRAPDLVQHWFYNALDPDHPSFDEKQARRHGSLLQSIYDSCDEVIGKRLGMLDEETILIVVSDHGFAPASRWFEVSRFLIEMGLLRLQERSRLRRLTTSLLDLGVVARLDVLDLRHRLLTTSSRIAAGQLLDKALSAAPIDWPRTQAYCCLSNGRGIRVNLVGREPSGTVHPGSEYESTRARIRSELMKLCDPVTGEGVVSEVFLREEIFAGPHLEEMPDLIFSLGAGPHVPRCSLSSRRIFQPVSPRDWSGEHRPNGILVAVGHGIRSGTKIPDHSIIDIAPTVLRIMGIPIPLDMDGRTIEAAFLTEFLETHPARFGKHEAATAHPVERSYSEAEEQEVLERLRHLGYLE
jgi:predicted AlkP superfamily phosphohydrolase/phosphomutase